MRVAKPILAGIFGAEAVLRVAERCVFPYDDDLGGYVGPHHGCVNKSLLHEAGYPTNERYPVSGTTGMQLGRRLSEDECDALSWLAGLNDSGQLTTREEMLAALTDEVGQE